MREEHQTTPGDEQVVARLRRYADAAEAELPPTPASTPKRSRWRSPLAGLAATAALVVIVTGAVLSIGGGGDDEVVTPAEQGPPATQGATPGSTEVPGSGEPCPGMMITLDQSATADPDFAVVDSEVLGYMPFRFHVAGVDADTWVELAVDHPSFGKASDAPVIETVPVTICNPMSEATGPVDVEAWVLDTVDPTVHVFVDNPLAPGADVLVIVTGGPGTTVGNLLSALVTFRWEDRPLPTTTMVTASDPPLQPARDDAHLITFDSVGPHRLGMEVAAEDPDVAYDPSFRPGCGAWYPDGVPERSETDARGVVAGIGRTDESDPFTVNTLYVWADPAFRTASGVGVGTDLASLQGVYRSDLVVDRMDGSGNPTDGLLALYRDVAAVRNGDRAITFTLEGDVVAQVKVSDADFWGDDEGCA